ncbi:sporulation protein SpoOM [Bacillus sp. FJAT-27231]|uniref:sporulation protein n=1 Tax=Bacillus sp. FJAT-27231 TaxID=1679168 RepID=UPI000670C9F2|nr:sporulation protein [Bacillus sp. FJAT-27231]KMY54536.1 sporulation protein SpoOM [Bacillus sp. FJAT-27231]
MSFFNKVLASIGIGAAKVDTKLEKPEYTAGETIRGQVEISGGSTEQQIDSIYLTVYTTFIREADDRKYTDHAAVKKHKLNEPFKIGVNEKKSIPFSMELPIDTPITYGNTRVWVATGLDIKNAADPGDKDYIEVRPTTLAASVLDAIGQLGFRLREVECEQASKRIGSRFPFVQEFEFVPTSGPFRGKLDELEVSFLAQAKEKAELLIQVDRKARGIGGLFAEALEMDETLLRLTVTSQDVPRLDEKLKNEIARYA